MTEKLQVLFVCLLGGWGALVVMVVVVVGRVPAALLVPQTHSGSSSDALGSVSNFQAGCEKEMGEGRKRMETLATRQTSAENSRGRSYACFG